MTITRNRNNIRDLTGIPINHQSAFQQVANQERCIIMSRAVGTACTQLIEEGYSSKGFHVKAKSCNWGPMSGFVLEDPNLTKRAPQDVEKQRGDLHHAFQDWNAKATPLYISEPRRAALEASGVIVRAGGGGNTQIVWGKQYPGGGVGDNAHHALRSMRFVLRKTAGSSLKNAPHPTMWAVRYHGGETPDHAGNVKDSGAVYAMVNPSGLGGRGGGGVRMAMTGDYDLFSLAVQKNMYRPGLGGDGDPAGTDQRMVGVRQLEKNITQRRNDVGEDTHLGNMTARHRMVRDGLNNAFRAKGYTGGNMVHHSDEAGRPFVDDVDLPVFAAAPGQLSPFGIADLGDLRQFWNRFAYYYVIFFNPGWMSWLTLGQHGASIHEQIRKRV